MRDFQADVPVETVIELAQAYKNAFNTPAGKKILAHMLFELHYFDHGVSTPEAMALRNYATVLIKRVCGHDDNLLVEAIAALPGKPVNRQLINNLKKGPIRGDDEIESEETS